MDLDFKFFIIGFFILRQQRIFFTKLAKNLTATDFECSGNASLSIMGSKNGIPLRNKSE
jgi:hypothetical protein